MSMLWLIPLLSSPADACGNDEKLHVVGWSEDGAKALVRKEHNDDEGQVHALSLHLLGAAGPEKVWEILTPEDGSSPAVRGRRWAAAEPEIAAAGIVLAPDTEPFFGCTRECFQPHGDLAAIPGTDLRLSLGTERTEEHYLYSLQVHRDDERVHESILYRGAGYAGEWGVESLWASPDGRSLVILTSHGTPKAWHLIPVATLSGEA